jgi:DNA mismatch endonuclease (patch repair protein)
MAAVKSKDTLPELQLRRALHAMGVRGWRNHYKRAPGTPDLAWPALHVAVFVDGAFWHGHPSRHKPGRSGQYWDEKICRNVERDRQVDDELVASGWLPIRVWDFEIRKQLELAADRIRFALASRIPDTADSQWQRTVRAGFGPRVPASRRSDAVTG